MIPVEVYLSSKIEKLILLVMLTLPEQNDLHRDLVVDDLGIEEVLFRLIEFLEGGIVAPKVDLDLVDAAAGSYYWECNQAILLPDGCKEVRPANVSHPWYIIKIEIFFGVYNGLFPSLYCREI